MQRCRSVLARYFVVSFRPSSSRVCTPLTSLSEWWSVGSRISPFSTSQSVRHGSSEDIDPNAPTSIVDALWERELTEGVWDVELVSRLWKEMEQNGKSELE